MLQRLFKKTVFRRCFFLVFIVCVCVGTLRLSIVHFRQSLAIQRLEARLLSIDSCVQNIQNLKISLDNDLDALQSHLSYQRCCRTIEHILSYKYAEHIPPSIFSIQSHKTSCDKVCCVVVYYGDDLHDVIGQKIFINEQEVLMVVDPLVKEFYSRFDFERAAMFYFYKEKGRNCLTSVLPPGLLDYTKHSNVVQLCDDDFDALFEGKAIISLVLQEGTCIGSERVFIGPRLLPSKCQCVDQ